MAFAVADRVKESTTSTGTGTINLDGTSDGFQTFVAGIGGGNTTYYAISHQTASEWEVGIGTVTDAATDTLSRDTIISSSNGGLAVNFSAGSKDVIATLPSSKSYVLDNAGDTTISADLSVTSISGSGAGLTGLNASNLASGTLPDARFPATLPASSGANLTNLNASNVSSGTLDNARLSAIPNSALENSAITINGTSTDLGGSINVGDITGVTAGSGLTGGGTTGAVTLNVGAGTGVTVNADDIAIGQDVATSATPTFAGATFTANVSLGDSDALVMGAASDFYLQHSGSHSYIKEVGTGNLYIDSNNSVNVRSSDGLETLGIFTVNGSVDLYYDNNKKFETTSAGITVTGTASATTFSGSGASLTNIPNGALDNSQITINGTGVSLGGSINVGDITGVTAGTNLTGGGTSGTVTLNMATGGVGAGTYGSTSNNVKIDTIDVDAYGRVTAVATGATGRVDTVTAGNGLTGGGSATSVTLNVGAGTGIDVAADAISVDVSDFMTNGSNNRVLTATGTDAMNAEANMTFDGTTLTVPALTETSSIAYKENVQPLNFNDAIYNINAVKYDRKDGSAKDEVGVIAEELYEVLPDLVSLKDGKPDAVKYTKMTMYLLEALKKQNQEIQLLKEKLNG